MSWLYLILAGVFEIGGIVGLKLSDAFTKKKPLIFAGLCMMSSFLLLSLSLREIPISIAYGIWTGIGAAGSVFVGMFFFREPKKLLKLLLVFGVIFSIVGLKFLS